jgi:hypothetical protein
LYGLPGVKECAATKGPQQICLLSAGKAIRPLMDQLSASHMNDIKAQRGHLKVPQVKNEFKEVFVHTHTSKQILFSHM